MTLFVELHLIQNFAPPTSTVTIPGRPRMPSSVASAARVSVASVSSAPFASIAVTSN